MTRTPPNTAPNSLSVTPLHRQHPRHKTALTCIERPNNTPKSSDAPRRRPGARQTGKTGSPTYTQSNVYASETQRQVAKPSPRLGTLRRNRRLSRKGDGTKATCINIKGVTKLPWPQAPVLLPLWVPWLL